MFGNNTQSEKIYRASIPLFTSDDPPGASGWPGVKYFFPDLPILDKAYIVGIEANLSTQSALIGDIPRIVAPYQNVTKVDAKKIYVTIFDKDLSEKFSQVPLFSLFPNNGGTEKRVHPFSGRIKSRKCYCQIPANTIELQDKYFVNLTFYYNPIN
jgi:hypothetical protein